MADAIGKVVLLLILPQLSLDQHCRTLLTSGRLSWRTSRPLRTRRRFQGSGRLIFATEQLWLDTLPGWKSSLATVPCCLRVRELTNSRNTDREHPKNHSNRIVLTISRELEHFMGLSFPTISSTGPNAAIIHYKPSPTDCAVIERDQIYLCDSGAQFLDGTTDVTRTWVCEL